VLFASFDFLLFFIPVLLAFWALRDRPFARTLLLIAGSYFFYMASARPLPGEVSTPWYYAGLLIISTVLDYAASGKIWAQREALHSGIPDRERRARAVRNRWLVASLVGNLGLLGYFKYTNFLLEAFTDVANAMGAEWVAPHLSIILPIGISFYTFQSLSYTIDVWRERLTPEPSFRKFALFVVFFPQLVAGPIVRASEFLPQLHRRPSLRAGDLEDGLFRIAKGLLKKVVLGDFIAVYFADLVFDAPQDYTSVENLLALYAFTLQIYADFSGYSDIAIGVAKLLGFRIPENFDRPYQSKTLGEFWRRWHMTLSTWLRDYLFFPLGGSRGSAARTYFNVWLTMFLVGMWHGASWNFVVYSNLHGVAMLFNRWNRLRAREAPLGTKLGWTALLASLSAAAAYGVTAGIMEMDLASAQTTAAVFFVFFFVVTFSPDTGGRWNTVWHVFLTFHFTVISRIFFRAEDLDTSARMLDKLVRWDGLGLRPGLFRMQGTQAWVDAHASSLGPLHTPLQGLTEWGIGIVLVLGTAVHWTNRRWVDEVLKRRFMALPGPVLGLIIALIALLLMHLLDGPRANIYFAF
jgi:D-alanyl-lipoteichoic acid acyltransferase DltB (MBOAT superfamily)